VRAHVCACAIERARAMRVRDRACASG
jgi:hypothetical protein